MNTVKCPVCGGKMVRNGRTAAGSQRWLCKSCRATETHRIDNSAKQLQSFLSWLLSRKRQADMPGGGRTFRRKCSRFWEVWPLPPLVDEIFHFVYVDGIYLARNVVVLIAYSGKHVLGWYLARSENSKAWAALLSRIAPPDVVVTDGGSGFEKARKRIWPNTRVQRCTFHAFCQVRRYTTSRPKLQAGAELLDIARALLRVEKQKDAELWAEMYLSWCERWNEFLSEQTLDEETGKWRWTHEPLVKARSSLNSLANKNVLFTYLDKQLTSEGKIPATTNPIEGGVNAQLRAMLRDHRGLPTLRRIKAVFWWCYMHIECPLPASEILEVMPTDDDIEAEYQAISDEERRGASIPRWGDAVVWSEFHRSDPWRHDWD